MDDIFTKVKDSIEYYAESIAKEILEKQYLETGDVTQTIKTRILFALQDIFKGQITETEKRRRDLADEYRNQSTPNWRKEDLKRMLGRLKTESKDINRTYHTVKHVNEYEELKSFVRERLGEDAFREFCDNYQTQNPQ